MTTQTETTVGRDGLIIPVLTYREEQFNRRYLPRRVFDFFKSFNSLNGYYSIEELRNMDHTYNDYVSRDIVLLDPVTVLRMTYVPTSESERRRQIEEERRRQTYQEQGVKVGDQTFELLVPANDEQRGWRTLISCQLNEGVKNGPPWFQDDTSLVFEGQWRIVEEVIDEKFDHDEEQTLLAQRSLEGVNLIIDTFLRHSP